MMEEQSREIFSHEDISWLSFGKYGGKRPKRIVTFAVVWGKMVRYNVCVEKSVFGAGCDSLPAV